MLSPTTAPARKTAPGVGVGSSKNRVWGFFGDGVKRTWEIDPQVVEQHLEKTTTESRTASGVSYWLSRDPIGEQGGLNLYCFVGNDGINSLDILGNASLKASQFTKRRQTERWSIYSYLRGDTKSCHEFDEDTVKGDISYWSNVWDLRTENSTLRGYDKGECCKCYEYTTKTRATISFGIGRASVSLSTIIIEVVHTICTDGFQKIKYKQSEGGTGHTNILDVTTSVGSKSYTRYIYPRSDDFKWYNSPYIWEDGLVDDERKNPGLDITGRDEMPKPWRDNFYREWSLTQEADPDCSCDCGKGCPEGAKGEEGTAGLGYSP